MGMRAMKHAGIVHLFRQLQRNFIGILDVKRITSHVQMLATTCKIHPYLPQQIAIQKTSVTLF